MSTCRVFRCHLIHACPRTPWNHWILTTPVFIFILFTPIWLPIWPTQLSCGKKMKRDWGSLSEGGLPPLSTPARPRPSISSLLVLCEAWVVAKKLRLMSHSRNISDRFNFAIHTLLHVGPTLLAWADGKELVCFTPRVDNTFDSSCLLCSFAWMYLIRKHRHRKNVRSTSLTILSSQSFITR